MATLRSVLAVVLALGCWLCTRAGAQDSPSSSSSEVPQVLFLDGHDNGKNFEVKAGDQIEIRLDSMGSCQPLISSSSLKMESIALIWPPTPGISTRTYIFDATSPGESEVRILLTDCSNRDFGSQAAFTVTVRVKSAFMSPTTPYAFRIADQDSAAPWTGAWMVIGANILRQSFKP